MKAIAMAIVAPGTASVPPMQIASRRGAWLGRNMRRLAVASGLAMLAMVAAEGPASAGPSLGTQEYCYQNSAGWGYCYGSLVGFFLSNNNTDLAGFFADGSGSSTSGFFEASFDGVMYYCDPTSTYPAVESLWPEAALWGGGWGQFFVEWDNSQYCNYLSLSNQSSQISSLTGQIMFQLNTGDYYPGKY